MQAMSGAQDRVLRTARPTGTPVRQRFGLLLMMLGAAALLGVATSTVLVLQSQTDDPRPGTADLSAYGDPHAVTDANIAFYAARVQRDPVDFGSYDKLGESYLQQARETGDIGAYQRAAAAFFQALSIRPDDAFSRADMATALYSTHDFAGALQIAQQTYATDSSATQALALVADANLAMGNYDAAYAAYGHLTDVASGPAVLSRLSYLDELRGDRRTATNVMSEAEAAAVAEKRPPESIAFYRLQLGTLYFGSDEYDKAATWYSAALDVFPGYYQVLAGLGNVEAARGHYDKAIEYYQRSVATVPQPTVLAALGDTYAKIGDLKSAQKQYDTVEFIGHLAAINQVVYNRELALFYADHGIKTSTAVDLALTELNVRKDVFGYDAAAWTLYKDGRAAEAEPYLQQAVRLGTNDARLLFHAGMIENALGNKQKATMYLQRALDLNPHFSVLQEAQARQTLDELKSAAGR